MRERRERRKNMIIKGVEVQGKNIKEEVEDAGKTRNSTNSKKGRKIGTGHK